jgi:hypothetical protein
MVKPLDMEGFTKCFFFVLIILHYYSKPVLTLEQELAD